MSKTYSASRLVGLSKPGMTNNPNGRPKGPSPKRMIQEAFLDMMKQSIKYKGEEKTFFTAYLEEFMQSALKGGWSARILAERVFSDGILGEIDSTLKRDRREDKDFMLYRVRKTCFDVQQKVLDSHERRIMLMAGRRAGKTEVETRKAISIAINTPNAQVLFIGLTFTRAVELFWNTIVRVLEEMGVMIKRESRNEGIIVIDNGSEFHFHGNSTVTERERLRGGKYHLVVIDEAQSQPALAYLLDDIIEPMLKDYNGSLVLGGTGPKTRGTWWETLWNDEAGHKALRLNWNLSVNPYIQDYQTVLDAVLKEKGWVESDPVFQTEYLGKIAYDEDALVYRMTGDNYFTQEQLTTWVKSQPPSDIKFVTGIDYGFEDCTALALLCYSTHKKEVFLIYEKKFNRSGVEDVKLALDECVMAMNDAPFKEVPAQNKKFMGYADTAGGMKMVSYTLTMQFGFNILPAIKDNKSLAIEQLQNEVKQRILKVRKEDHFDQEALRIIFGRDDNGNLTREISDEYHPDMQDALLYAFRHIWSSYPKRNAVNEEPAFDSFFPFPAKLLTN